MRDTPIGSTCRLYGSGTLLPWCPILKLTRVKHLLTRVFSLYLEKSRFTSTRRDIHKPKQSSALTVEKGSAVGRLGESLITGISVDFLNWKYSFLLLLFSYPDAVSDQIWSRFNRIFGSRSERPNCPPKGKIGKIKCFEDLQSQTLLLVLWIFWKSEKCITFHV